MRLLPGVSSHSARIYLFLGDLAGVGPGAHVDHGVGLGAGEGLVDLAGVFQVDLQVGRAFFGGRAGIGAEDAVPRFGAVLRRVDWWRRRPSKE